jgi:hypothetical protein
VSALSVSSLFSFERSNKGRETEKDCRDGFALKMGQKTPKYVPNPASVPLGQNAQTLDELLLTIKDEYVYNTRVFTLFHILN